MSNKVYVGVYIYPGTSDLLMVGTANTRLSRVMKRMRQVCRDFKLKTFFIQVWNTDLSTWIGNINFKSGEYDNWYTNDVNLLVENLDTMAGCVIMTVDERIFSLAEEF